MGRECTNPELLPRFAESPGDNQADPQARATDKGQVPQVQDQGIVTRLNAGFQEPLKFIGVAAIDTTDDRCNQNPVFPFPLSVPTECLFLWPCEPPSNTVSKQIYTMRSVGV
jgi:hypothetical protein